MDQYKWNIWSSIIDLWNAVNEWCSSKPHICSSIFYIRFMEFHNYTRSFINNHGVPWLIMELHNWIYMSSIDNYGTPYSSTFFFPVGTPYALNKRTGLILAECISLNLYDTKLFVWAKYRIMLEALVVYQIVKCHSMLMYYLFESIKHKRLCVLFLWLHTMMTSGSADACWSPLLLGPQTGYPR